MRRMQHLVLALLGVLLVVPAAAAARRPAHVPIAFVGMNIGNAIDYAGVNPVQQFDKIVSSGVGSVRVTFDWRSAQPYPSWSDVPADQRSEFHGEPVPTNFTGTDASVALAARRRLDVLPVVLNAPEWDAVPTAKIVVAPMEFGPYVSYVKALVHRYGPHGSFWSDHPAIPYRPIRQWQVWNEPNLLDFWTITPWVPTYMSLLEPTSRAIKAVDPGAKVVLAGLPNFSWLYLKSIYRIRGARRAFDVVAVHPYTRYARGVIAILRRVRAVMNRNGDRRTPLIATELGWPSSLHQSSQHFDFETTEQGQATKLAALMPLIERNRRQLGLGGFYYYTWMDLEFTGAPVFNFAGLFAYQDDGNVVEKPAYPVFRHWALSLTGCRAKGPVATACLRR